MLRFSILCNFQSKLNCFKNVLLIFIYVFLYYIIFIMLINKCFNIINITVLKNVFKSFYKH